MSLTLNDLANIRAIIREENQALENDVKEIYGLLNNQKQNLKKANTNILSIAKHLGLQVPKKLTF